MAATAAIDPARKSRPSFFVRHFCKPDPVLAPIFTSARLRAKDSLDSEKGAAPRFSFRSRGAIVSASLLFMALIAIVAVILGIELGSSRHRSSVDANGVPTSIPPGVVTPSPSNEPGEGNEYKYSQPPARLAVLANFPDPSIYYDSDSRTWYAWATNNAAGVLSVADPDNPSYYSPSNIQVATSTDFENWDLRDSSQDPLPTVGAWAKQGNGTPAWMLHKNDTAAHVDVSIPLANTWAPYVIQHPTSKSWLLYYAAKRASGPGHCVGAATSDTITGPFTPLAKPLACPANEGGAIDPAAFIDEKNNNTIYVAYKIDGNSIGHGGICGNTVEPIVNTPIMIQRMEADGVTPDSTFNPHILLNRTAADGPLIEAPELINVNGTYFLFFNSGCTRNNDYALHYATASSVLGPYSRATSPLLVTGQLGLLAPGSVSVKYVGSGVNENLGPESSGWKIALHGRVRTAEGGVRATFTAGLAFEGLSVSLVNGTGSVTK